MSTTYDDDLYAWTRAQADALRRRAYNELDVDNLAEEIESLGKSEKREIRSRLKILLIHLLKWHYQPEWRSNSWHSSIDGARYELDHILQDNPSLRAYPSEELADAYRMAIIDKDIRHLELLHLPTACPWTIDQVLDAKWLP